MYINVLYLKNVNMIRMTSDNNDQKVYYAM